MNPMEAQELTDLLEKLIDKKIERLQVTGKNIPQHLMQNERETAEIKAKLVELLHPLFT